MQSSDQLWKKLSKKCAGFDTNLTIQFHSDSQALDFQFDSIWVILDIYQVQYMPNFQKKKSTNKFLVTERVFFLSEVS